MSAHARGPGPATGGRDTGRGGPPARLDQDRFLGPDQPSWPGHWASPPASWDGIPESRLLARETLDIVEETIAELPPSEQQVITLRDIHGLSSDEVRAVLELSEVNQRVLLHRARSKVRRALEGYLG